MGYFNTTTTSSQSQTGNRIATTYNQTGREWDPGWDKGPVLWRWVDRTWTEYSWVPYTFTPAKTKKELKIVGLKNAYLQPSSTPYGMTLKKFDTASYVDRAILQLKNETAGNVVVRDISIRGEPVYQIAGQNGFIWEYSDYDSIDKNGEQFKEIGNDFIFDASQAESIGDFAWKLLKPHQVYTLALRGCQYQYQIGDVYTLNIDYSLDASSSQIELVNVDVEVIGISFERSVGSVGSTMLACRVDLGAWSKTTSRRAQLVGTGQANNNTNRTNTVTVASSTYTGTADYYCDGTDDNVQIQQALDDTYAMGGGTVWLTRGDFYISSKIEIFDGTTFRGSGISGTIIHASYDIDGAAFLFTLQNNTSIMSDMTVDGDNFNQPTTASVINGGGTYGIFPSLQNVEVYGFKGTSSNGIGNLTCVAFANNCHNVIVHDCSIYNNGSPGSISYAYIIAFAQCTRLVSCETYNLYCDNSGGGANARGACRGFFGSSDITSCYSHAYTTNSPSNQLYGYDTCNRMLKNNKDASCLYNASYADAGTSNPVADTAAGGYNS